MAYKKKTWDEFMRSTYPDRNNGLGEFKHLTKIDEEKEDWWGWLMVCNSLGVVVLSMLCLWIGWVKGAVWSFIITATIYILSIVFQVNPMSCYSEQDWKDYYRNTGQKPPRE